MRMARVIGTVTLNRRLPELAAGTLLLADVLDSAALRGAEHGARRAAPMPESLVVFDALGAGVGQIIAVSEGREAAQPFGKRNVPIDAYCAAILDTVQLTNP